MDHFCSDLQSVRKPCFRPPFLSQSWSVGGDVQQSFLIGCKAPRWRSLKVVQNYDSLDWFWYPKIFPNTDIFSKDNFPIWKISENFSPNIVNFENTFLNFIHFHLSYIYIVG